MFTNVPPSPGPSLSIIFFLVFVYVVAKLGGKLIGAYRIGSRSFENYRKDHPDCVGDGRVKCCQCGGESIFLRRLTATLNSHVCRVCGHELYRSRTPL